MGSAYKKLRSTDLRKRVSQFDNPRALHQWAQEHSSSLRGDESTVVWEAVASFGRVFDEELIRELVSVGPPAGRLARSAKISGALLSVYLDACISKLESGTAGHQDQEWIFQALTDLRNRDRIHLADETGRRLWSLLAESKQMYGVGSLLGKLFASYPETTADQLAFIANMARSGETAQLAAVHENADIRTWKVLLTRTWSYHEFRPLLENPNARTHPEIRFVLRTYGRYASASVLRDLAPDAEAQEFAELFRDILALDGERYAPEVLKEARPEQCACLSPEDLLPLLSSAKQDVRLSAMAASAHIRENVGQPDLTPRPESLSR